jgi:hypothetical protein
LGSVSMGKVCNYERRARNLRSLTFVRDDNPQRRSCGTLVPAV